MVIVFEILIHLDFSIEPPLKSYLIHFLEWVPSAGFIRGMGNSKPLWSDADISDNGEIWTPLSQGDHIVVSWGFAC